MMSWGLPGTVDGGTKIPEEEALETPIPLRLSSGKNVILDLSD